MTSRCKHDRSADEKCAKCEATAFIESMSWDDIELLLPLLREADEAPRKYIGAKQRAVNMLAAARLTVLEDNERCGVAVMDLATWLATEHKRSKNGS